MSVNPNNPDLVQLYNTRQDAVNGVNAIALDNSKATGTTQSLTLVPDTGTQARINGGTVHAGGNVEVNGQETIQAAMDSSFTFNFDPSDSSLLNLSNNRTILVTGGESGGWIQGGAVVTAGGDVTVQGDADNTQQLSGDTAVNGTENIVAAAIEDATVSTPTAASMSTHPPTPAPPIRHCCPPTTQHCRRRARPVPWPARLTPTSRAAPR